MASIKFYAQGIQDATLSAVYGTGGATDSAYPLNNLKLRSRRYKYQTAGAYTMTSLDIIFDYGTSIDADYFYIDKNNTEDIAELSGMTFYYWNGSSYVDTGWSQAVTNDGMLDSFTPVSATKFKLSFTFTTEPATEFWANFMMIGEVITFDTFAPDYGTTDKHQLLGLVTHTALNGSRSRVRISQVADATYRGVYEKTFKTLTLTEFNKLDQLYTDTEDRLYPFLMVDEDSNQRFVSLQTDRFRERMRSDIYNSTTLTFEDEL